jgi:starch-binding outer membrane protein, SusD/RagB family
MKRNHTYFFIPVLFMLVVFLTTSCDKDFLNTKPTDRVSELDVFQDQVLLETFVNDIYSSIQHPFGKGDGILKAEFVDEAHDMWYAFYDFNNCLMTSDNLSMWWFEKWGSNYMNIRKCNLFFEKYDEQYIDNSIVDGVPLKDRINGEVYFLRAYFYHQLVSMYGGVPIVDHTFGLTDDFKVPRNTYAECIKFIVDDLDMAASLLPEANTGSNKGRATKGAALALKSEVLLYAASDLHNNNSIFSGFSKPELLGYIDGDAQARWLAAKNAAKDVIDLGLYDLYKANPGSNDSIAQNYADIFIADETDEDIFVRYFTITDKWSSWGNNLALVSGPNGYHLWGEDTPSGNLVDDYEMANGTKFDWSNPLHAAEPYKNRDPRFYATVLFEGVKFKERPSDIVAYDPIGVIQVGVWETWDNTSNSMVEVFGLDTRQSFVEGYNGGYTGYYLRKFINPSVDAQFESNTTPWRYIRYGEILLNYAEACIELHEDAEALIYINMIRKRAGMPEITETGAALRERYRHERRVELAFEDNRFYDVRRWVIGPETYVPLRGVDVRYVLNPDKTTATIPTIVPKVVQQRSWIDKAYFFPIMRTEINKNDLLVQNPGY